ncbi:DUF924 family protein [uncultured Sneathiella sp.]|jgi:uncharacterized protein (DUF924 family)|uniref:DUF924 family protein n=1 Tax=uncultured Sneathiella sp. TaxID=879315 RepID=UPI002598CB08|nr:DUF924 family protein [uncultured Sneathiella sp.]
MDRIQEILDFWFLPENHANYGKPRKVWFQKDADFDAEIRSRFLDDFENAEAGRYLDWAESARGSLALIILFDQFTRNMFRESPRAFAADGKAREIARHMLSRGFYDELNTTQKQFAALPFEHSEDMEDQKLSLRLFKQLGSDELVDYAERHYDIIEKFGRFPHRNKQLNRQSTKEEEAFLKKPNSSF